MKTQSLSEKVAAAVLGLCFVLCISFQFYALNKGFDITDEGYNLQLIQSRFVGISNTYFFEWVQLCFGWLPHTLFINRMVATVLLIGSSLFFAAASFRYFQIPFTGTSVFFCLLFIPFAVTLDPVTLSYNNTTATLVLLSAGSLLMLFRSKADSILVLWLGLSCGVFAAMACVTKITSGLALSLAIPLLILVVSESRWKHIGWYAMGWFGYHLLQAVFYTPFYQQLQKIMIASDVFAQMDAHYEQGRLLNDTYLFTKDQLYLLLQFAAIFAVARFVQIKWVRIVLWLCAATYFFNLFEESEFQLTGLVIVIGSLLCAAFFLVEQMHRGTLDDIKNKYKEILMGLFLWFIPLIVVIGTNNVYYHNYVFAGLPLAVFCVVTLDRTGSIWYKNMVLVWIGACVTYVCYTKILNQPYRILPLTQQTETVKEGRLAGIKLDRASKERYQRLGQVLTESGFTPQNGLVCLGKMQGLQYLLEASSPGGVMFSPTFKELYLKNLTRDTHPYGSPYFVLADYRFADSLLLKQTTWERRFSQTMGLRLQQKLKWKLKDSIPFETAPLGKLYLYISGE
jgi:hypothetical protein